MRSGNINADYFSFGLASKQSLSQIIYKWMIGMFTENKESRKFILEIKSYDAIICLAQIHE